MALSSQNPRGIIVSAVKGRLPSYLEEMVAAYAEPLFDISKAVTEPADAAQVAKRVGPRLGRTVRDLFFESHSAMIRAGTAFSGGFLTIEGNSARVTVEFCGDISTERLLRFLPFIYGPHETFVSMGTAELEPAFTAVYRNVWGTINVNTPPGSELLRLSDIDPASVPAIIDAILWCFLTPLLLSKRTRTPDAKLSVVTGGPRSKQVWYALDRADGFADRVATTSPF